MPVKRLGIAAALVVLAAADVFVYRGHHLFYRATERTSDLKTKIALLESAQRHARLNDRVFHALGRAHFDEAVVGLGRDPSGPEAAFGRSRSHFLRSLALNPFSPTAQFDFAQALQYMSALGLAAPESFIEAYQRAARLSGLDSRVFADVGRIMMTRWETLSPDDRGFAANVVRELLKGRRDPELLESFLGLWEFNIRDPEVLSEILPPDAAVFRRTAAFLAEKSLDRDRRLEYLSRAEALDFASAKAEFQAGRQRQRSSGTAAAIAHFQEAKSALDRIYFFQNLTDQILFDATEYRTLRKSVLRESVLSRIDLTRRIDEADEDLQTFLRLEDSAAEVGQVEAFLRERGLIESARGGTMTDFGRQALSLWLDFKQHRFREVVQTGQALGRSILHVPEEMKPNYGRILEIIGDAYQKLDYLYESNVSYEKAMEVAGDNVHILLKMRKNYERLNDPRGTKAVDGRLLMKLSPTDLLPPGSFLAKGIPVALTVILRGSSDIVTIELQGQDPASPAYLSVKINRQVVWDDFAPGQVIRLSFMSSPGENEIEITSLNEPVALKKIAVGSEYVDNKEKT